MKKTLGLIILTLSLSSCTLVRLNKMNIEQGNIITPQQTSQLHTGMSIDRVKDIMGTPVLINTFSGERIDYVYTYKPGYGEFTEKTVTLNFKHGVLRDIQTNSFPQPKH